MIRKKVCINEIWVEKAWTYESFGKKSSDSEFSLIITFKNNFDSLYKNGETATYLFAIEGINSYYQPVKNIKNNIYFPLSNHYYLTKIKNKDTLNIYISKKNKGWDYSLIKEFQIIKK